MAVGLAAGLALTATLPPLGWWPLGPVAVAGLVVVMAGRGWRGRLVVAVGTGLGLYLPGMWWATEFHAVGWVVLVGLQTALLVGPLVAVPGRRSRLAVAAAVPSVLVVAEAVRARWPFGGLPLSGLDLGQVAGPLLPVARVGGNLLLVAAMAAAGAALAAAWWRRPAPAAACLGVVTALAALGVVAPDGHDQGPLSVAAVQGGGPRGLRAVDSDPRRVFDAHLEASRRLVVPGSVDLVLWPEDVVDVDHTFAGSPEEAELSELARELGATVVAGVVEEEAGRAGEAGRFRNAAVVFGPDGAVVSRYDKVHRVPFGEYVPWRSFLDGLVDLSAVPRDAVAGEGAAVVGSPHGRLAVVISYEVFFADRARSGVTAGGRLLLVPTNASSYTTEQVPAQEVAVARLRAVETGRWTVQAAPTGYSVIVDHRGRVVVQGGLGGQEVLAAEVRLRSGLTLASRAGDWPVLVLAGLVFGLSWAIRKKT